MTDPQSIAGKNSDEAFPPELPRARRHTLCGEPNIEQQVCQDLARLSADAEAALAGHLRSLVLIGRFARGEGSVVVHNGEILAHGGYHCLALVDRLGDRHLEALHEMERTWTGQLRVQVRLHLALFQHYSKRHHTLWWLDLARGGIELLSGDATALSALQSIELGALPRDEAGFLLTEQAVLLALALSDGAAPNLVRRQRLHSLVLACGDATLLMAGRFTGGVRARLSQLRSLLPGKQAEYYAEAIAFLERPDLWHVADEDRWQAELLHALETWHLALEGQRCGAPTKLASYVRYRGILFDGQREWRALSHQFRDWLRVLRAPPSFPYVEQPLERLARIATGLIYGNGDAGILLICARLLGLSSHAAGSHSAELHSRLRDLYAQVQQERDDPAPIEFYA